MKKLFFETEKDGFYGTYYENPQGSDCAVIGLFGDDSNDYMAKCGAKWLHKNGVNVLCMSPGKKNYSHVNYPLERIETAIKWLKNNGNRKVGIMGMSTAGMDSIVAASYFPDITLTFGLTPSDFVWQGFEQGKRMAAVNGRFRAHLLFPGRENHSLICRLCMNIRFTGRRLWKKRKVPVILNVVHVCSLILKKQENTRKKR